MKRRGAVLPAWLVYLAVGGIIAWFAAPKLGLHIGKTVAEKAKAAEVVVDQKSKDVLGGVQQNIHQGNTVLGAAMQKSPNDRLLETMHSFFTPAQVGLDQVVGAPSLASEEQWKNVALGLISENAEVRAAAQKQHEADAAKNDDTSKQLGSAQLKMARLQRETTDYAIKLEAESARSNWLLLGLGLVIAAVLMGGAPVFAFLLKARNEAKDVGARFGQFIGRARAEMPAVAEDLRSLANEVTDDKHQKVIGEIADKVHDEAILAEFKAKKLLGIK